MLWYAYLPLLALPTAVVEMRSGDICKPPPGSPRLAFYYNNDECAGNPIVYGRKADDMDYNGSDMDNNSCMPQTIEESILPGMKDQVPGLYCLLTYDDSECNCVTSWLMYNFTENVNPGCVKLDTPTLTLETFGQSHHRWHRTCDEFPDCPQGCYDPEQ